MLSNLPIGIRIGLVVVSSLFTLFLLGAAVMVGERQITGAARDLDHHRGMFEQVTSIERRAAQLRLQAARFITARDEAAPALVLEAFADVRQRLDNLKLTPRSETTSQEVDTPGLFSSNYMTRYASIFMTFSAFA